MLKRFSHIAVYLLLALMPLQSIAAANMLICNSMMTMNKVSEQSQMMPCHEHMNSTASNNINQKHDSDASSKYKDACKANCAHCASMCAMAALPSHLESTALETSSQTFSLAYQSYASITLPNLQRPPIRLS
ncbi:MAG: hypothetical protein PSV17_06410 [Methylotenera sp.]|uniref:hypothetical protein n=1 Tax=Methylotenera sp. TaxID=2051956 RepID=UPI0024884747|nr:hypothetical protein [Methylotenera sp.]MDI1309053.1 hypothetical protein [Methylotenera sp.]